MKKTILTLASVLFCAITFAQNVPQGINYQGVARDGSGTILSNHFMSLKASVYSDTVANTMQWQELHTITTNDLGVFAIVLGTGFAGTGSVQASFTNINWNASTHYIKIELDHGSGFMDYGTTALQSVPYALAAETADEANAVDWTNINNIPADIADGDDVDDADNSTTNEIQSITLSGDTLYISGGNNVDLSGYNAGVFATDSNVTSNANGDYATDDFVFGSPTLDYDVNTSDGVRMFFDKSTGAFRVGRTNNTNWDVDSLGPRSFASGYNTKATGFYSTAMGYNAESSANYSTAMGSYTNATGMYSTAMGYDTEASGHSSTAMGYYTDASASYSTAIGRYNVGGGDPTTWVATDPLFEIGNGTGSSARSNALTILKNGNIGINTPASTNYQLYNNVPSTSTTDYAQRNHFLRSSAETGAIYSLYSYASRASTAVTGSVYGIYGYAHNGVGTNSTYAIKGYAVGSSTGSKYAIYGSTSGGGTRYAGYFSGDVYSTGSYLPSDESLKKNISDYNNALDQLSSIQVKEYEYIHEGDMSKMDLPKGKQVGIMAQNIENVFPQLTKETEFDLNDDPENEDPDREENIFKFKAVNYTGMIPITVKAIQEQQEMIKEQQEIIKKLEDRITQLENN